ncbi:MAG: preprotein translocase subunit SecE [Alistipes sp.]|jgi:preprotein translocase subunit SecE|nr:preprotein translocase subunit SecE [Alistipes sp.]
MGYIKNSYKELVEKVSWPSFAQLQSSTLVVMIASLIFAIVVLAMDMSFEAIMQGIYKFLGNLGR